jgi:hypothetical protein
MQSVYMLSNTYLSLMKYAICTLYVRYTYAIRTLYVRYTYTGTMDMILGKIQLTLNEILWQRQEE